MRSLRSHPVAILREIIGLRQKDLAKLVNMSPRTIQAVEVGALALSERLATQISSATGVDVAWLLDGKPEATPKCSFELPGTQYGTPYTKAQFETYRAYFQPGPGRITVNNMVRDTTRVWAKSAKEMEIVTGSFRARKSQDQQLLQKIRQILETTRAEQAGPLVRWKVGRFIDNLCQEMDIALPEKKKSGAPEAGDADSSRASKGSKND